MENDEYEGIRSKITQDKDLMAPSLECQELGLKRGLDFINKKFTGKNAAPAFTSLPEIIKFIVLNNRCSCRRLAEIIYDESHNDHGDQYSGRDLKRWSAMDLDELFRKKAFISRDDNGFDDFWHEW